MEYVPDLPNSDFCPKVAVSWVGSIVGQRRRESHNGVCLQGLETSLSTHPNKGNIPNITARQLPTSLNTPSPPPNHTCNFLYKLDVVKHNCGCVKCSQKNIREYTTYINLE